MAEANSLVSADIAVAGVCLVATVLTLVLRAAGVPGGPRSAPLVAGIVLGLLCGPGVFGLAAPHAFDLCFRGGATEAAEVHRLATEQAGRIAALVHAGADPATIEAARADIPIELTAARHRLADAREQHRFVLNMWMFVVLCAALASTALLKLPGARALTRRRAHGASPGWPREASLGLVLGALLVLPPALIALLFLGDDWRAALAIGVVFGVTGMAGSMRRADWLSIAGASALTMALVVVAAPTGWVAVAAGVAVGSAIVVLRLPRQVARRLRRQAKATVDLCLLPTLVTLGLVALNPYEAIDHPGFWVLLVLAIFWSADGRLIAVMMFWRVAGRASADPWKFTNDMLDNSASLAQVLVAGVLLVAGAIEPLVFAAAIVGSAVIELTAPARSWLIRNALSRSDAPE